MAETGEAAASSETIKLKEFKAKVVEVTFESDIKVSHSKATVAKPHWSESLDASLKEAEWKIGEHSFRGPFSKRPAVYLAKRAGGGPRKAKIKVKVEKSDYGGTGKLSGALETMAFEGDCPLGAGEHIVEVTVSPNYDSVRGFKGTITWKIEAAEFTEIVGSTVAEVYFVLEEPADLYDPKGVWVEALRFLCYRVKNIKAKSKAADVTKIVTKYCHSDHGLKYDTVRGSTNYCRGSSFDSLRFLLLDYMACKDEIVNCYDQASAIQVLCGALGVKITWLYLDPFGFLNESNLVGVGMCNNPFFRARGANPNPVVASDDPGRTPFGNHAFCVNKAFKTFDACAGPHVGTENTEEYLIASIDSTTRLYAHFRGLRPGNVSDIKTKTGVASLV